MKQLFIILCSFFYTCIAAAQNTITKAHLQKIAAEKSDNSRINLILEIFFETSETDPLQTLKNQQEIFGLSQKNNDPVGEALSLACIGHTYRSLGNNEKSLEYALRGFEIAQETGNKKLLAIIHNIIGNCYKDIANYNKAKENYRRLIELCDEIEYDTVKTWGLQNMSEVYIATNRIDPALFY